MASIGKLYVANGSPPARSTMMVASVLDLNFEKVFIDLISKEQYKPEYLKLNPQHIVPTLEEENGFVIWESHALNPYLVDKYAKDDALYPKDLKKRTLIDQRLFFDSGKLQYQLGSMVRPLILNGHQSIPIKHKKETEDLYEILEIYLETSEYVAGDSITIADFNIVTTVDALSLIYPVDSERFPKVTAWHNRIKETPAYQTGLDGLNLFKGLIESFIIEKE